MLKGDPQWSVFSEHTIRELVDLLGGRCEGPEGEYPERWHAYMPSIEAANRLRSNLREFERYEVANGEHPTHVVIYDP